MVRDGIVFKDEDGQVIFNQHSFCELVKHLLVELVGLSLIHISHRPSAGRDSPHEIHRQL